MLHPRVLVDVFCDVKNEKEGQMRLFLVAQLVAAVFVTDCTYDSSGLAFLGPGEACVADGGECRPDLVCVGTPSTCQPAGSESEAEAESESEADAGLDAGSESEAESDGEVMVNAVFTTERHFVVGLIRLEYRTMVGGVVSSWTTCALLVNATTVSCSLPFGSGILDLRGTYVLDGRPRASCMMSGGMPIDLHTLTASTPAGPLTPTLVVYTTPDGTTACAHEYLRL